MGKLKKDSLVLVRSRKNPENFFYALIEKVLQPEAKGCWAIDHKGERHLALPDQVIPIVATDGSFKDPDRAVKKLYPEIISMLVRTFSVQKEADTLFQLIRGGSLVVVLPDDNITEPQWGIVLGKIVHSFEINISRSFMRTPQKILVPPEKLIPVINTDLETKNPLKALRKNWGRILMYLILRFYTQKGSQATRRLLAALSSLDEDMLP